MKPEWLLLSFVRQRNMFIVYTERTELVHTDLFKQTHPISR